MNNNNQRQTVLSWLENQFLKKTNGVIIEKDDFSSFELIQNFIEKCDCNWETPVIYYEAFPEESAAEFFDTLYDELLNKLGHRQVSDNQSLSAIIKADALKMVIIDKSHLHPLDTLNNVLEFFANCNVALVLVGSGEKMKKAQILNHSLISSWSQFTTGDQHNQMQNVISKN